MRIVVALSLLLVLVVASAMTWQHRRYVSTRRDPVQDRQSVVYSRDAFHALYFLATAPGEDVIDRVRAFRDAQTDAPVTWIYAGLGVESPRSSAQLEAHDWSAVVLAQYPSREAYDTHAASPAMVSARRAFEAAHVHGLDRPGIANLLIPQALLALRAGQLVTGAESHFPFEPMPELASLPEAEPLARRLLAAKELGERAIVVVNLMKSGDRDQRAANLSYGRRMLGSMAEGGYGPMHMGRSVTLEGDAAFDTVALVYYPGVQFFANMTRSAFFQGIVGDKQLGDTQVTITVPILDRL